MAKVIGKYFIAWIPSDEVVKEVTALKHELFDQFGLKYALKSPPHVTLKMPFSWNEAKEDVLIQKISQFLKDKPSFPLTLNGFGKFGKRVIFISVQHHDQLMDLQKSLVNFCKIDLKLIKELSDSNYHPHMTVAFKDVKEKNFSIYWDYFRDKTYFRNQTLSSLSLLKRVDGKWKVIHDIATQTL